MNVATPVVPPQSEWGLDPLYWSHVRVTIAQVHALLDVRQLCGAFVFAASRRPVARVEVVGNIVSIKVREYGSMSLRCHGITKPLILLLNTYAGRLKESRCSMPLMMARVSFNA